MLWPPSETYPCWVRAALTLILFGLSGYVAFFVALISIDTFLVLKGVYLTLVLAFLVSGAIKGYYGWWELRLAVAVLCFWRSSMSRFSARKQPLST